MNTWIYVFYYHISGVASLLSGLGLWFTAILPGIDRWSKRFFRLFFTVLMLCSLCGIIEFLLYPHPIPNMVIRFVVVIGTVLVSLPLPMLTVYLLHCCGKKIRSCKIFYTILGLWTVYFCLLASLLFSDAILYVTPEKQYYRGPLFPLLMLPIIAITLINLASTIRWRKLLSRKAYLSFLIALLPMTVTLIVHVFVDIYPFIDISIVISALSMYSLILSDQIEQDLRHQREKAQQQQEIANQQREIAQQQREIAKQQCEIANQHASIMVLQMRPHFIYNTMTSIYCLCNQDPQLARQVVLDFTTYLRKNFTALASSTPIPFSSELEHTRAYLAVEQAQYEDSLFVDYDTPHIWFRLPPLTLQPIVENAVKHGRDPYAGPFHISIRTRKTDSGSEIIVADDGRGFHPTEDDEQPHIALKNIQQRLEIMCGGSLTIGPNEGGGTLVTVTIPDSDADK